MKFFLLLMFIITLFSCTEPTTPPDNGPDTTSHNFTWQIDTLGDYSSYLKDVAIIDENDIWVVGEIRVNGEEKMYNAAHWDGTKWTLNRIMVRLDYGQTVFYTDQNPIKSIFAVDKNDVWFVSNAGGVTRLRNENFEMMEIAYGTGPGGAKEIWGSSSDNMYFVGYNGNITHYDGTSWTRLESGTDIDIQDIWGNENEIYAVASYEYYGRGLAVLKIDGTSITKIDTTGLRIGQSGIWFDPDKAYYIVGDGVFRKDDTIESEHWMLEEGHPLRYKTAIRGNSYKDLFIVGSHGMVSHYNGSTWKHYAGELPSFYGSWWSVSMYKDMVVAVGTLGGSKGLVLRGYRK